MHFLRGWLFDNLGLKFTALLLAVLVYLNVFTDRPATLVVSFPIDYKGLADSLTLSGPAPSVVEAELRGTGKQLIAIRVREPRLTVSLEGVHAGRFDRAIGVSDLPLPEDSKVVVEKLMGPLMLELTLDHRVTREIPVAMIVLGEPAAGFEYAGAWTSAPYLVRVTGPAGVLAGIDSLRMSAIRVDGRRDSVSAEVGPEHLPQWCSVEPLVVTAVVKLPRSAR